MIDLLIKIVENNYSSQLITIIILFFLLIKSYKVLRLFLVFVFKKYHGDIKYVISDYSDFKNKTQENFNQVFAKLDKLRKTIDEMEEDCKRRNEKNGDKIYELLRDKIYELINEKK